MSVLQTSWGAVGANALDQSMTKALIDSFSVNTHPLPEDSSVNMAELCAEMAQHLTSVLAEESLHPARVEKKPVGKDASRTYIVLQGSGAKPKVESLADKLEIDLSALARRKRCVTAKPRRLRGMSTYEAEAELFAQRQAAAASKPSLFECAHQCGFQGAYAAVEEHENACAKRIDLPKLRNQVHFYLSDENLCRDWFFYNQVLAADDGWIDMKVIAQCPRVQQMGAGVPAIFAALQSSPELETCVGAATSYVRRRCLPPFLCAARHARLAGSGGQELPPPGGETTGPGGGAWTGTGPAPGEQQEAGCAPLSQSVPPPAGPPEADVPPEALAGSSSSRPTESPAESKPLVPGVGSKRTSKPLLTSFASLKSGPGKLREWRKGRKAEDTSTTTATTASSPRSKASSLDETSSTPSEEHV